MLHELEAAKRDLSRLARELTERRKAGKRTCAKCKRLLAPDAFYRSKSKKHYQCKKCMNATRAAWREANREKEREAYARRMADPEYVARRRARAAQRWREIQGDPVRLEQHRAAARARAARRKNAA